MQQSKQQRSASHKQQSLVPQELIFWCAIAVIAYSLIVPLVAFESLQLAEQLLYFGILHQCAILLLVLISMLWTLGEYITKGWNWWQVMAALGTTLLLMSIQPAAGCCSRVVAFIAGALPFSELPLVDVVFHCIPIVGSSLLIAKVVLGGSAPTIWYNK